MLLDFGDLVVHVFHEQERIYYGLERLWKDCPVVPIELPARRSERRLTRLTAGRTRCPRDLRSCQ